MKIPHRESFLFSVSWASRMGVNWAGLQTVLGIFIPGRAMAGMPEN
jgi:hypothetical protein